jgi:hypothetical protein
MNPPLAEALGSAALLGAVIRPLLVATVLLGLWHALARAKLGARRRLLAWGTVASVLIGWVTLVWTLAARGVLAPVAGSQVYSAGVIVAPTVVLVAVALTLLTRSATITAAIDAAPLWWLIAYQAYRVAGFIFVRLWSQGFLPGYFALPAGIGDALTGAFAILVVATFLRNWSSARVLAYAVNIFGMVDLLNAISIGVFSTIVSSTTEISPMLLYPLVIVPSFGVPLAFIIHSLSIWQLRRRGRLLSTGAIHAHAEMRKTA